MWAPQGAWLAQSSQVAFCKISLVLSLLPMKFNTISLRSLKNGRGLWLGSVHKEGTGTHCLPSLALGSALSLLAEGAHDRWDVNHHFRNTTWLCPGPVFSFLAACFGKNKSSAWDECRSIVWMRKVCTVTALSVIQDEILHRPSPAPPKSLM